MIDTTKILRRITFNGVEMPTGGVQPTLNAVSILRYNDTLSITNPATNGNFVSGYKIFDGDTLLTTQSSFYYNLYSLGLGAHSITVKASGTNFQDSAASNAVTFSAYSITNSLTNLTTSNIDTKILSGNTYIATLTPASGYYLPETITVTVGGLPATFDYNAGSGAVAILAADITGNIVITAVASDVPVTAPIYGVSGMYNSSTTLTRTDDAVGMSAVVNSSTGTVSSDFDDVFPWNEATVETIDGNKFLHLPDMWFRVGKDSNSYITDIAVSKEQGATGDWYKVDSFYYGCYGGSNQNDKLASVSGVSRLASQTRAQFRTLASANGSGYHQLDLYHHTVMLYLWWIEFANKNSQSIMRGRDSSWGGTASAVNTGGTDSLTTPSGFNTTTKQMRYHYIEDFVGNCRELVDGTVGSGSSGGAQYVTANPALFSDSTSGLNTLSYNSPTTSGNCITAFGWDSNNPFLMLPIATTSNSVYSTYFCDYGETNNDVVLYVGSRWDNSTATYGVSYFYRDYASYTSGTIGGRLLYKP